MFIYQRSSLNGYAGIRYALENNIPFVLEYNSSELWTCRQWGRKRLSFIKFSMDVERLLFEKATLITCVSEPLKRELIERGIEENKIIITPNGVDTQKYTPEVSGDAIRDKFKIDKNRVVIGFIGTFGKWHGVAELVQAYIKLAEQEEYRQRIHLMLIGDGMMMPAVRDLIGSNGIEDICILTGIVPQLEGPAYLAACDILVAPTIENPDGTPFFGSPTKLFEYMAMGKAIVATKVGQIGEILRQRDTAMLVRAGDTSEMVRALKELIDNEILRNDLGMHARAEVCGKYTWDILTERIVNKLRERIKFIGEENK